MRELPRDLVTILRTEARNQRTPPIDYIIAEDGGRAVRQPDPDIAMAELLEEAAAALTTERAALAEARKALRGLLDCPDIADNDYKDEETHAAERAARRALTGGQEPVAWPEPKVTNPDIANPTGVPYLDCLIHRLLDAQQDINLAANERMDQSLCEVSSLIDEVETCIRRFAATRELAARRVREGGKAE